MKFEFNNPKFKERRKELRINETTSEKILWKYLRNKSLENNKFYRQFSVGPYILDFYCPKQRLAIEIDGNQHLETDNLAYDQERTLYLESKSIKVIRYFNNEINENVEYVLENICKYLGTPPS